MKPSEKYFSLSLTTGYARAIPRGASGKGTRWFVYLLRNWITWSRVFVLIEREKCFYSQTITTAPKRVAASTWRTIYGLKVAIMRELRALWPSSPGVKRCNLSRSRTSNQMDLENGQLSNICWTSSCTWSHKGQDAGCGIRRRANLSAVHNLSLSTSQTEILTSKGAQELHSSAAASINSLPKKNAR